MGGFILEKDRAKVPDRRQLGAWDVTALRYVLCYVSNLLLVDPTSKCPVEFSDGARI